MAPALGRLVFKKLQPLIQRPREISLVQWKIPLTDILDLEQGGTVWNSGDAYSDSPIGKRIYPKVKEVPHKSGALPQRYEEKGTDPNLGVADPATEEKRYDGREAILQAAALENPKMIQV